jgi:TP901 family phage tail tape measure protein
MPILSSMIVKLGLDAQGLEQGLQNTSRKINKELAKVNRQISGFNRLGGIFKGIGTQMTTGTLALTALAGVSVKAFADFNQAMTQSLAIMGDVSDSMQTEMAGAARAMARESTFSAKQAAESFFFLASAGLEAEASVKALPVVAKFAQAGMFDMALATDLLTDAQSALGLTIRDDAIKNMENMVSVSDVLVKANTLANATVQQFSEALTNKAGPAMRASNVALEEGVAVLAAFADQGVKGSEAGTQFGIALRDLQTKAIKNADEFRRMGIAVFDSQNNLNNLGDIVGDLEGALDGMSDKQRKATLLMLGFSDKSVAALQALLGTSEAIKGYEADLRSAGGITKEVADKQLTSLTFQLKLLKNDLTDTAIELGQALAPALRSVVAAVKPLLATLGGVARWFGELPQPVQTTVIALAGVAAAIGPLLFVSGQLIQSVIAIKSAFAALSAVNAASYFSFIGSSATGLAGILTGPVGLIALLGVGLLGALYAIDRASFDQVVTEIKTAMLPLVETVKDAAKEFVALNKALAVDTVRAFGEVITVVGQSVAGIFALRNELKELVDQNRFLKILHDSLTGLSVPILTISKAVADLRRLAGGGESVVAEVLGTPRQIDLTGKSYAELKKEAEALGITVRDHKVITKDLIESLTREIAARKGVRGGIEGQAGALDELTTKSLRAIANQEALHQAQANTTQAIKDYINAGTGFGKTIELQASGIEDLAFRLDLLTGELKRAQSATQATIDATKPLAETIEIVWPDEYRRKIEEVKGALDEQTRAAKEKLSEQGEFWRGMAQQVSTIITDLGKNFSNNIIGLFTGRGREQKEKLAEERDALVESLAEREQEWINYQQSVSEQIDELRANSAAALAEEEAAIFASLDERRIDYEQYVQDINRQIDEVRQSHTEKAAAEVKELRDNLDERRVAYEDYKADVTQQIIDVTQQNRDQLAERLDDLDDNLREQTEQYDDFVTDTTQRLGDLKAEFADDLGDQTRNTQRRIADSSKRLKREEQDIKKRIARLTKEDKKGNAEQIKDLKIKLKRRQEDHAENVRRLKEDLQDWTEDHERKLAQQERDINDSLERRARDFQQFNAEHTETVGEVTDKANDQLEKQVGDLQASLDQRTADFNEFTLWTERQIINVTETHRKQALLEEKDLRDSLDRKTATWEAFKIELIGADGQSGKLGAVRTAAAAQLDAQEADLIAKLGDQRTEWETFVVDVNKEIAKIGEDLKDLSFWSQAKSAFQDMLFGENGFAAAIARFGSEYLTGKLFKWLKEDLLDTIIPNIKSALSGLFGGGASGSLIDILNNQQLGNVGGPPATPGGGGAAVAGGLAGTLSAVGALGSFATGLVGIFQARAHGQFLDKIEQSTRFTAIATIGAGGIVDTLREFLPKLKDIHDAMVNEMLGGGGILAQINDAIRIDTGNALQRIDDVIRHNLLPTTEDIRALLGGAPTLAVASPGVGVGITINITGNTFSSRDDIDDLVDAIDSRLNESMKI